MLTGGSAADGERVYGVPVDPLPDGWTPVGLTVVGVAVDLHGGDDA